MTSPLEIDVTYHGKEIHQNMGDFLEIDDSSPDKLANQLRKNAKVMFYWGSIGEYCTYRKQEIQNSFDLWYAKMYKLAKEELLDNGETTKSKLTESMIKYKVMTDHEEKWKKYHAALLKWEHQERVLGVAVKAFKSRGDALINLLSFHKKVYEQEED